MAYKIAASMALKNANDKCKPVILEPVMKVEVTVPEEYMGDVMGDINSRRGRIDGMEARGNAQVIRAMFHYLKCLDMQQHYVLVLKDVENTQWNMITMNKFQNQSLKKSSKNIKVNNHC